jgi:hypothetical protein
MKRRLDKFDLLPAVWDETAEMHSTMWTQIDAALAAGELNRSERRVLLELRKRLKRNREARRLLGFTLQRSKHSERNAAIADDYVEGREEKGQSAAAVQSDIMRNHKIGPKALQKITDSGEALGRARGRALPRRLAGNPPNNRK